MENACRFFRGSTACRQAVWTVPGQNPIRSESSVPCAGRFWGVFTNRFRSPVPVRSFSASQPMSSLPNHPEARHFGPTCRCVYPPPAYIYGCAEQLTRLRQPDRNDDEGPRVTSARRRDPPLWRTLCYWVFPSPAQDACGLQQRSDWLFDISGGPPEICKNQCSK
jgi:hypothetical protein